MPLPFSYSKSDRLGISSRPFMDTGWEPRGPGTLLIVEIDRVRNAGGGSLGAIALSAGLVDAIPAIPSI